MWIASDNSDSGSDSTTSSEDSKQLKGSNDTGPIFNPGGLPIQGGMITCPSRISSRISEISMGVDNADLFDGEGDEECAPKKGMHQQGGLLSMLPLEEEFSDSSDDDRDHSSKKEGERVKIKAVMHVIDQIVNDKYGDSGFYTGSVTEEALVPHGQGVMIYENEKIYDGEWREGKWHGKGKWTNADGDYYEGDFVNDQRQGFGTYRWPNGNKYIGEFQDDSRNGKGTFKFSNNAIYEGEFKRGRFEGKGSYSFGTGMYDGEWMAGKYNGKGFLLYSDGSSYTGEFEGGLKHGEGEESTGHGRVTKGFWIRDKHQSP